MVNKKLKNNQSNQNMLSTNAREGYFEIHIKGQLDESWSDWLGGLDMKLLENGEMILSGYIGDQAALIGIINKLYRLNLTLLSLSEANKNK